LFVLLQNEAGHARFEVRDGLVDCHNCPFNGSIPIVWKGNQQCFLFESAAPLTHSSVVRDSLFMDVDCKPSLGGEGGGGEQVVVVPLPQMMRVPTTRAVEAIMDWWIGGRLRREFEAAILSKRLSSLPMLWTKTRTFRITKPRAIRTTETRLIRTTLIRKMQPNMRKSLKKAQLMKMRWLGMKSNWQSRASKSEQDRTSCATLCSMVPEVYYKLFARLRL
jgi:hypothetical protein